MTAVQQWWFAGRRRSGGVDDTDYELREDGSIELRENGEAEVREERVAYFARLEGIHASGNGVDGRTISGLDPTRTYEIILRDDGDGYEAWSFNTGVTPSWVTALRVRSDDASEQTFDSIGGVDGAFPTRAEAYANRNPSMLITGSTSYYFYLLDNGTNADNAGGLSITLQRV